jgi:hypothetical protein
MGRNAVLAATAIAGLLASGCGAATSPRDQAAEVERVQCGSSSTDADDERVIEGASVIKSEPLYSHVITNTGFEERVDGAKLVIRPPEGVSAERMTRVIQCHSARALLGKIDNAKFQDDPFWLPDTWVSVEVHPEEGNYAVTLEANDIPTNLRLAARAKAYASTRPLLAAPSLR